jgi:hypothetical protein
VHTRESGVNDDKINEDHILGKRKGGKMVVGDIVEWNLRTRLSLDRANM